MKGKTCCVSKAIQCFYCSDHCVDKVEIIVVVFRLNSGIRHAVMTHNIEKPGSSTCDNLY